MSLLWSELAVFLILQFLEEEKFKETVHRLEQESGLYFNMGYFEEMVTNGEWDEVEKYLSGFTKVDDNRFSMEIFFEIRKQKYLESLDKGDRAKAVEILVKDLRVFAAINEELFKRLGELLTLENFRDNEQLSKYGDTKSARGIMLGELKKLIEANPLFRGKLQFPALKNPRLRTLINQSLNWQHLRCKSPGPNPDIRTLFADHGRGQPNGARAPSPVVNSLVGGVPKTRGFPPITGHGPYQPTTAALSTSLAGWMANPSFVSRLSASAGPIGLVTRINAAAILKRRGSHPTNNTAIDYQTADSVHVSKKPRPFGPSDEVNKLPVNIMPISYSRQNRGQSSYSSDDLPKNPVMALNQGSAVKSMDFHPVQKILLLVGTNAGEVMVWELSRRERIACKNFKVWDLSEHSTALQESLFSDYTASVNRVAWSPDGTLFGVAYSRHIVHVYSYHGGADIRNHLEMDAHNGNVNDLAFACQNKLVVVTCGDDRTIRVWDAVVGTRLFNFKGHDAPVYSVCPSEKKNIKFIYSTATDGKIKAWLYYNAGSRVDYDAPGHSSTTMAYSADGTRLFSCGTNKEGESHLVEWNEREGAVKRNYNGLAKRSVGAVKFDTTNNRFLAAGDEFKIKFWDMDNCDLLTTIDAQGGLPASPCIRFNKDGSLLVVSTKDNGIKILANSDGIRLLQTVGSRTFDDPRAAVVKAPAIGNAPPANATVGTSIG